MVSRTQARKDALPFGWVEYTDAAIQRLRREMEEGGDGVVDEMGVLAIHTGYADYFFPGTSVLHTRPRYLFFVCWNFLALARAGVKVSALSKAKDAADLWVTSRLMAAEKRGALGGAPPPDMSGIIGRRLYLEEPPRLPAQRIDFVYWTALRRWGFYRSLRAPDRARLFRRWSGSDIVRIGDGPDASGDDAIREEPLAELNVPAVPPGWLEEEPDHLTFELTSEEARALLSRLLSVEDVAEGPRLLSKAAQLCAELPPRTTSPDSLRPWDDPLALRAARACGQEARLERASRASALAHYVRAIYAALVEATVERTRARRVDDAARGYREGLRTLAADRAVRDAALGLALKDLQGDVPGIPRRLWACLERVQHGLAQVENGADPERALLDEETHRLFELAELDRKGPRARLPDSDDGAARRLGFDAQTIGVYDLDYRWTRVSTLLWDLHQGLNRA